MEHMQTVERTLLEEDSAYVWHPFTQHQTAGSPTLITKAKGAYLFKSDNTALFDAISSWWVNLHGHSHPHIVRALHNQLKTLDHVLFAGITHPPATLLAKELIQFLPSGFSKVFFSDNGSTAVEVAIKMALQKEGQNSPKKMKVLSFQGSYHGDTFGAMSASGKSDFNRPFWNHMFHVETIPPPLPGDEEKSFQAFKSKVNEGSFAAFIFEPLVLASGGMKLYDKTTLALMIKEAKKNEILTIGDEVMTGFYRLGAPFASHLIGESPDILCLSKGITGGFLPLGATVTTDAVFSSFLSDDLKNSFLHGHSYTGNPLSCRAALASLELLKKPSCKAQVKKISHAHQQFTKKIRGHDRLHRIDSLGTLLALELKGGNGGYFNPLKHEITRFFLEKNIFLRPLGNVLYLLPPYCTKDEELKNIFDAIEQFLER